MQGYTNYLRVTSPEYMETITDSIFTDKLMQDIVSQGTIRPGEFMQQQILQHINLFTIFTRVTLLRNFELSMNINGKKFTVPVA